MSKISGIETHCAFDKSVDVVDLIPHPRNPNKHDDKQIALLAKIIRSQGWRNPIVVSERSGFIISGHGRLEAAKMLNVEQVPVDLQAFENEAEEYAHLIADNRIAELAETDRDELADLIRELDGEIDLDLTGFDEPSLAELLGESAPGDDEIDAEPQIDKAAELQKKWNTALGQVWELGNHRLLCGDCTDKESVDIVVGGETVDMVFTDPPYNVAYQSNESIESLKARKRRTDGMIVQNDSMSDEAFDEFLDSFILTLPTKKGGAFYMCAPSGHFETQFRTALARSHDYSIRQCIVWVKDQFVFGRQDYQWRHESILYGWREGGAHYFVDDHTQDTVWEIARPRVSEHHPTMKPIALCAKGIANSSKSGDTVFDPFLGSGTTLMACENLGRKCRAIEINPGYVAVALERWAEATGKTPKLIDGA